MEAKQELPDKNQLAKRLVALKKVNRYCLVLAWTGPALVVFDVAWIVFANIHHASRVVLFWNYVSASFALAMSLLNAHAYQRGKALIRKIEVFKRLLEIKEMLDLIPESPLAGPIFGVFPAPQYIAKTKMLIGTKENEEP